MLRIFRPPIKLHTWSVRRSLHEKKLPQSASNASNLTPSLNDTTDFDANHGQQDKSTGSKKLNKSSKSPKNQKCRRNEINIQLLTKSLHKQIFRDARPPEISPEEMSAVQKHLSAHGLWNRVGETQPEISFKLPELHGKNIDDHFRIIANEQTSEVVKLVETLLTAMPPPKPQEWKFAKGWTKYESNGETSAVDFPDADIMVFDIECLVKEGNYPVMATALSPNHWYSWCGDYLIERKFRWSTDITLDDLIPLETKKNSVTPSSKSKKVIIGHNVGFDRSFVKEQYLIQKTKTYFLDTLSMHVANCGLTGFQRILYKAGADSGRKEVLEHKKKQLLHKIEPNTDWKLVTTMNNLNDVYQHYTGGEPLEKETRDTFVNGNMADVRANFQKLMEYCANDVAATHSVFIQLWPEFRSRFPHPVTLAGMLEMSSAYLPINANWERYLQLSNAIYDEMQRELKKGLMTLADETCSMLLGDRYKDDPWLWDLDWSTQEYKLLKPNKNNTVPEEDLLPAPENETEEEAERRTIINNVLKTKARIPKKPVFMAGFPKWYRDLCKKPNDDDWMPGPCDISTQKRVVPKLLRLTWEGFPLHYDEKFGWGYLVPKSEDIEVEAELPPQDDPESDQTVPFPLKSLTEFVIESKSDELLKDVRVEPPEILNNRFDTDSMDSEERMNHWRKSSQKHKLPKFVTKKILSSRHTGDGPYDIGIEGVHYYKMPHKSGSGNRVGNPLAKDFLMRIEDGTLKAATGDHAERVLFLGKVCSYWKNNQDRIGGQMAVWMKKSELPKTVTKQESYDAEGRYGAIVPRIMPAGTVTRRAVESTWLTASNAYPDRIGSELKAMIQSPPGYHFVGADVDSQELWIAAILGDAYFMGAHGCTALGWMTLQGKKAQGTDLHSKTAETATTGRDHAKVLNYARIYGAGQKYAEKLLQQFNPKLTPDQAHKKAALMYSSTKGKRNYQNKLWYGGSESYMFNELERIAKSENPRTPVLGSRISKALEPENVDNDFMTSRVNWVVQSSAVDYLHMMLVCMRWLIDKYKLNARFAISIHDEVRYLVDSEDRYQAALALQITNLLTRSMFAYKLRMNDLPQSVAFFSAVDIDVCLRKEVVMDCKTPSNIHGLNKGYNIQCGEALDIYKLLDITNGTIRKSKKSANKIDSGSETIVNKIDSGSETIVNKIDSGSETIVNKIDSGSETIVNKSDSETIVNLY